MKTKWNSLLTAAGFALIAAAAYGQDRLTANVPFSFRTIGGVHPAGQYAVVHDRDVTKLENLTTRKSTWVGIGVLDGEGQRNAPRLVFTCGNESGCALTSVRIDDGREWRFQAPKLKASEEARVAVIYLGSKDAE
ncbi:MAG TPA: hypothetical protein VIY49_07715 [Bryobacteraceae bacterium]